MDKLINKEDQGQYKGKICERKSRYVRIIGVCEVKLYEVKN